MLPCPVPRSIRRRIPLVLPQNPCPAQRRSYRNRRPQLPTSTSDVSPEHRLQRPLTQPRTLAGRLRRYERQSRPHAGDAESSGYLSLVGRSS